MVSFILPLSNRAFKLKSLCKQVLICYYIEVCAAGNVSEPCFEAVTSPYFLYNFELN